MSIAGSLSLLLLNIFRWTLVDMLTPFFEPFIDIMIYGLFFISSLTVLIYCLATLSSGRKRTAIPILINLCILFVVFVVPFNWIIIQWDFHINQSKRNDVVRMISEGALKPSVSYNDNLIRLPAAYTKTSKGGGEIIVKRQENRTQILFFTYRGVADNMAGFIYSSDNSKPDGRLFGEDFIEMKQMAMYWYWVSGT